MEKKSAYIISLIFLVIGLSFLVNSRANITGAVIGVSATPSEAGFFAGASLILVSFVLFAVSIGGLEKKIIITNSINQIKAIKRLADKSRRNQTVARDLDNLKKNLEKGNIEAGLGRNYIGKKIYELRSRGGARVYYMETNEGYNIIGESSKNTQQKVINELKKYYT